MVPFALQLRVRRLTLEPSLLFELTVSATRVYVTQRTPATKTHLSTPTPVLAGSLIRSLRGATPPHRGRPITAHRHPVSRGCVPGSVHSV